MLTKEEMKTATQEQLLQDIKDCRNFLFESKVETIDVEKCFTLAKRFAAYSQVLEDQLYVAVVELKLRDLVGGGTNVESLFSAVSTPPKNSLN